MNDEEPLGLLAKINPQATWLTVLMRGIFTSVYGTTAYGLLLWWNQEFNDWLLKLTICATLFALIGGLVEWQVPNNEELNKPDL